MIAGTEDRGSPVAVSSKEGRADGDVRIGARSVLGLCSTTTSVLCWAARAMISCFLFAAPLQFDEMTLRNAGRAGREGGRGT